MPLVLLRYIHPCWIGETEEVFRDLLSDAPVQKPAMEVSREASLHQPGGQQEERRSSKRAAKGKVLEVLLVKRPLL